MPGPPFQDCGENRIPLFLLLYAAEGDALHNELGQEQVNDNEKSSPVC